MGNTGQDAYPKKDYNFVTNEGNSLKLICGHMFFIFLICRYFRPEYTILSDWNSLFTLTQKEASCLYVGKPPLPHRPVARLVSPRSCAIDSATLHDWSHDHVRPVCDLMRFVIASPEFWTWPSTLLRPNLLVRSPTTSKINRTICQQFICDSSYYVVVYRS